MLKQQDFMEYLGQTYYLLLYLLPHDAFSDAVAIVGLLFQTAD